MDTEYDNVYEGALYIDTEKGIATFLTRDGTRLLRVTHLPAPIPKDITIDVVAIRNVTSYTPIEGEWRDAPQGSNKNSDSELETRRHVQ